MKIGSFAPGLLWLAAAGGSLAGGRPSSKTPAYKRRMILGFGVLALLSGCASPTGVTSNSSIASPDSESQGSRFGRVVFAGESSPARFSFQKAKGKLGSAKEAILDSANLGLSGLGAGVYVTGSVLSVIENPGGGDPSGAVAFAGVAGGVTAVGALLIGPAVGAEGLYRSMKSVNPIELVQREAALTNALSEMAQQQEFRKALIQAGVDKILGRLVTEEASTNRPDGTLELRVDELRLERAGSSEGSYFLRIKTHARLTRVVDGAICFDRNAEYRSGTDLFLDWTMQGAVQGVAETGYRALARFYVNQLLASAPD
jgi:hypothetical protein